VARPKTLRPADFAVMTTALLLNVRHDLATPCGAGSSAAEPGGGGSGPGHIRRRRPDHAEQLFVADLDPGRLADELPRPVADLAERAHGLYEELLRLYCAHPVEQLTAHPTFVARAAVAHAADRNATSGTARYGTFRGAAARPHRRTHSRPQVSSRRTRPDERNPLALVPVERSAHGP
jgi:hypothetical protein